MTEQEKCKSFAYFFEHYIVIKNPDGSERRPNEFEIASAKLLEEGRLVYSRGRRVKTPLIQGIRAYNKQKLATPKPSLLTEKTTI